ncbi:MAG: EFR1 family ferrodoxin [Bacteroidales bacterium]|nr:EFR1 family ferrodoxin [Bacteroidales bacterium]
MICWFSGTGNSHAVAHLLAEATSDCLMPLTFSTSPSISLSPGEPLGLVFPIYGWDAPNVVRQFVENLSITITPTSTAASEEDQTASPYIYMVCTCGDDIGLTHRLMARRLHRRPHLGGQLTLNAAWSVVMPNTYTALPGFDTDAETVVSAKLEAFPARVAHIASLILQRATGIVDVRPGALPWTKSHILGPLFHAFLVTDKRLHTNSECLACRSCQRVCPVGNIRPTADGRPTWQGHCTGCLACYHTCPNHSLACGRFTRGKGQYRYQP